MNPSKLLIFICLHIFLCNHLVFSDNSSEKEQDNELHNLIDKLQTAEDETASRILCLLMKGHASKCNAFPRAILSNGGQRRKESLIEGDKHDWPCNGPRCNGKVVTDSEETRWKLPKRKDSIGDAEFYSGW